MALNAEEAVQPQSIFCLAVFPAHPQGNPTNPGHSNPENCSGLGWTNRSQNFNQALISYFAHAI